MLLFILDGIYFKLYIQPGCGVLETFVKGWWAFREGFCFQYGDWTTASTKDGPCILCKDVGLPPDTPSRSKQITRVRVSLRKPDCRSRASSGDHRRSFDGSAKSWPWALGRRRDTRAALRSTIAPGLASVRNCSRASMTSKLGKRTQCRYPRTASNGTCISVSCVQICGLHVLPAGV